MTLTLDEVTYRYAGAARPSLRDVSLELGPGEVVGLVGASESGKTTLCLVASGLAPRTVGGTLSGRLLLDGTDLAPLPIHALAGRIGIVFSSPATQLTGVAATVYEEVAFGPMNLGLPRPEVIARTESAMADLGIEALAGRDPSLLSGGQQQLVSIAGLLALRPAHLVLDEPTAQLDPAGTRLVAMALTRLAGGGASILVAEQKTDLLALVCHRVVAIEAGRVTLEDSTRAVLGDPRLEALGVDPPRAIRVARLAAGAGLPPAAAGRLDDALAGEGLGGEALRS
jgi:energy-coupling factor transporter ATP-binding protein EcfA2